MASSALQTECCFSNTPAKTATKKPTELSVVSTFYYSFGKYIYSITAHLLYGI